jgi:hypothetical protein
VDISVHLLRFTQVFDLRKKSKANSELVSAQHDRNVVPPWVLCCEIKEGGHCRAALALRQASAGYLHFAAIPARLWRAAPAQKKPERRKALRLHLWREISSAGPAQCS